MFIFRIIYSSDLLNQTIWSFITIIVYNNIGVTMG